MATIQEHRDFEYSMGMQRREIDKYDTVDFKLIDLVKEFKKNKKHISVGRPLTDYRDIFNNVYLMVMKMAPHASFVIREDFNFVIGYHELKFLYRWMYKKAALIYDNKEYYYEDMSDTYKEAFEALHVRVRRYDDSTNINAVMRRYYNNDVLFESKE